MQTSPKVMIIRSKVLAVSVMAHQMLLLHKASRSANAMIKNTISTPNLRPKRLKLGSNKAKVLRLNRCLPHLRKLQDHRLF